MIDKVYDAERGDSSLLRVRPLPLDGDIGRLIQSWRGLSPDERETLRRSLTLDDIYTLIQFAKRMAVRALNGSAAEHVELGFIALSFVDESRIDSRDARWAAGLLTSAVADGSTFAEWGYRTVRTDEGIGLIRSGQAAYNPTIDLMAAADAVIERVLSERYQCEIEIATDLPSVWFDPGRRAHAEDTLKRARGIASIHGTPRNYEGHWTSQMLVLWLAEMPSAEDGQALVADVGNGGRHVGRSVAATAAGNVFAVLVAGSTQIGVAPHESRQSTRELIEQTRQVLLA